MATEQRRKGRGQRPPSPRLRTGDRFEAEVRDLTHRGLGVVPHPTGRVFFAGGVWPGERGRFEVTRLNRRGGDARLLELTAPSPQRLQAPCPHHGFSEKHCGGCAWMFMDYAAQLHAKQTRVNDAAASVGTRQVHPIRPAPATLGYRNRAQLKSDGRLLGFQAPGSHAIVDVRDCLVLDGHNRQTLLELREQLPNRAWRASRRDGWTTLHIDTDLRAHDVQPNRRRPFRQGNTQQNAWLCQALGHSLRALGAPAPTVELFAGSGNFTGVLVDGGCAPVTAVDSFAPAVDALEATAGGAVKPRCLPLDQPGSLEALRPDLASARLLVLDPPREGFAALAEALALAPGLDAAIYVSCDVATWARDCASAREAGFHVVDVQPLDLFPHTPHVELLSLLTRGT